MQKSDKKTLHGLYIPFLYIKVVPDFRQFSQVFQTAHKIQPRFSAALIKQPTDYLSPIFQITKMISFLPIHIILHPT